MYSFFDDSKQKSACKGVTKSAICHDDYVRCIFGTDIDDKRQSIYMNSIRSKNHELFTTRIKKISLSCMDDKSYYLDNLTSLRHGHCKNKV